MSTPQGYDFGALYGMADTSSVSPLEPGNYDAIVEEAEFGRTKDGTKGAWTIKFRTTTGERAGYPLTMTLSINPTKSNGEPNPQGLGIMYRQLSAMGVPLGPPVGPPGEQPFWVLGWTEHHVAQAIKGKPVQIKVFSDEYDGVTRSKVRDIRPPRPGAPLQVQKTQPQQAMYGQPYQQGYPAQPAYGEAYQQPQQPAYGGPGGGYGPSGPATGGPGYQQQPGPVAPQPWQQQAAPPQQPPADPYGNPYPPNMPQQPQQPQGQPPIPGAPAWAQPPQPGQGGMGEFTQQGQSYQPSFMPPGAPPQQPPANGQAPQQPAPPPQGQQPPQQGAPELPPWAR